jgi:hypothetical protein
MRILLAVALIVALPAAATAADDRSSDGGNSPVARTASSNPVQSDRQPVQQFGHIIPQIPAASATPTPTLSSSRLPAKLTRVTGTAIAVAPVSSEPGGFHPLPDFHQRMGITSPSARVHRPAARAGPVNAPPAAAGNVDLTENWNDLPRHHRGLW